MLVDATDMAFISVNSRYYYYYYYYYYDCIEKHSLNPSHALIFLYIAISILRVSTVWNSVSFKPRAEPHVI